MDTYTEDLIETYEYFEEDERILYKDSTYDIVSKVAYLIGVPKHIFENEHEPPKLEIYEALDKDKAARIIRNLCVVRAAIERKFGKINDKIRKEYKTIYSLPELIPQDALRQLELDGASFYKKSSTKLAHHIIEINKLIRDRINNCKHIFPVWLNWDYIRDLFNMKDGLTEEGTKAAAGVYFTNLECYPYSIFINWNPQPNGNILYNDKKFVTLLYRHRCSQTFSVQMQCTSVCAWIL